MFAPAVDLGVLQATLKPILDTLPNVEVPALALRVGATPDAQTRVGDKLTRRALQLNVELAGTPLLDVVVGEATVDATGVTCGSVAAAALGIGRNCTTRRLTLIDVVQRGNRVQLRGAADPRRFAGHTVRIVSRWNGRTVARLKVAASGLFTTKLKLPPSDVRHSNRARYQAFIGSERSLSLKLDRRMIVTSTRTAGTRKVTLSGRITGPLGTPVQRSASRAGSRAATSASSPASARLPRALQGHAQGAADGPRLHLPLQVQGEIQPCIQPALQDVHTAAVRRREIALYRAALMQRRTKIVATIGPASRDPEVLARMVEAGMDVARLNFSTAARTSTPRPRAESVTPPRSRRPPGRDPAGPSRTQAPDRQVPRGRRRVQARRYDHVRLRRQQR